MVAVFRRRLYNALHCRRAVDHPHPDGSARRAGHRDAIPAMDDRLTAGVGVVLSL